MATPTETYSAITTTECQPNKPLTSELALRWRGNLIAAFQGASGAPRLANGALERLDAGNTQRALNAGPYATGQAAYADAWTFHVLQGGTVRFKWEHRVDTGSDTSTARVLLTRAGVATGYGENATTSNSFVAASIDVSVQPGDLIVFQHKITSIQQSEIQNMIVATGGADLWPAEGLAGYIDANTTLT